jgi:putative membrane protein
MRQSILWFAALFAALPPTAVWAQQSDPYYGSHMWNDGWHFWFLGPVMMIAFVVIAVAVVIVLVRWLGSAGHGGTPPNASTSLDILKERFARGEIEKDEFEEKRRILDK